MKSDILSEFEKLYYNESQHLGKDYASLEEVAAYDQRHQKIRKIEEENSSTIQKISLKKDDLLIDIGAGTGEMVIQSAQICKKVYAVDISKPMLEYAQKKAKSRGVFNVEFFLGGFLTYEHKAEPVDVITTSLALHHIPDFWKFVALQRLNKMLKKGGKLFIQDVVFTRDNFEGNIINWIDEIEKAGNSEMAKDLVEHIRNEHSTFDWIMTQMLEKTGFKITSFEQDKGVMAKYLCSKI